MRPLPGWTPLQNFSTSGDDRDETRNLGRARRDRWRMDSRPVTSGTTGSEPREERADVTIGAPRFLAIVSNPSRTIARPDTQRTCPTATARTMAGHSPGKAP